MENLTLDGLISAYSALLLKREEELKEEEVREIVRRLAAFAAEELGA